MRGVQDLCCASQVPTSRILKFVHLRHASDHLTTQSMKSRSSIIGAFLNPPAASRGKARSHFFQVATTRMSSACLDKRRAFSHVTRLCMATSRSMLLALARSECHVHGTPHAHRSAKTRETANIKRRSPRRPSELEFHEHLQSWQSCRWHSEHSGASFAVESWSCAEARSPFSLRRPATKWSSIGWRQQRPPPIKSPKAVTSDGPLLDASTCNFVCMPLPFTCLHLQSAERIQHSNFGIACFTLYSKRQRTRLYPTRRFMPHGSAISIRSAKVDSSSIASVTTLEQCVSSMASVNCKPNH